MPFRIAPMPAVLEYENVTKEYSVPFTGRRVRALQAFSLVVQPGEIFGFLGPNGAGKSTAIHLAMGFMRPSSGCGRMLGQAFGNARTRRRVGFLAENVSLFHRPADSLVRFYGALNGMSGKHLAKRTLEVLNEVGLGAEAKRNVKGFSRGMLQRVGLAQAIVNDPELLILDEPTSALDPRARVIVRELLIDFRNRGKTIFLSSHLLSEVEVVCDRVAVLNSGKLVRLGTTSNLLESNDASEIAARGIPPEMFTGSTVSMGLVHFHVPVGEQRAALERVWQAGGEVVSVNPLRKSLEELFLELTSVPDDHGSTGTAA
jgi:ABC-2 type transport system ATP-binding protein